MKPQIPTPQDIVNPAILKLIELRPRAEAHVYSGRYGDIFEGWKAQARLNRDRMASEAIASRLISEGDELRELARSEYWAEFDETPRAAIGELAIVRQTTNASNDITGNFTIGVIPAGTKFAKRSDPDASPPVAEMIFETTATIVVDDVENLQLIDNGDDTFTHAQAVFLNIVAQEVGRAGNTPNFLGAGNPVFQIVDPLFDPLFSVQVSLSGGGSDGLSDPTIRQLAKANYLGQFGPTHGALIAAALGHFGIEHAAVMRDTVNAISWVFIADASWGCSTALVNAVEQFVKDHGCGFGGRIRGGFVTNMRITVTATVVVESAKLLSDTTELLQAIQKRLRQYFDERPDWYTWRLNTVGAATVEADKRLIACTEVSVLNESGDPIVDPPAKLLPGIPYARHYYLVDDAVRVTFVAPT